VFSREEIRDGKSIVRVALADTMVAAGCVKCHNTIAGSPKTDWKLGDVRGVLEVATSIVGPLARGNKLSTGIVIAIIVSGSILSAIAVFFATRVATPLKIMTGAMSALADGDKSVTAPGIDRNDEIGAMARAV
jgi:methyl-accepting chemotaxis protein